MSQPVHRQPGARPTRLTVLAGPTAVGKGSVSADIRAHHPEIWISVSATTRAPRPGEEHGVHYWFVSDAEFDAMVERGRAAGVGRRARRRPLRHAPGARGRGARPPAVPRCSRSTCRAPARCASGCPEAFFVFLAPPSWEELVRRLVGRGTETEEERERRLATRAARAGRGAGVRRDHREPRNSRCRRGVGNLDDWASRPTHIRRLVRHLRVCPHPRRRGRHQPLDRRPADQDRQQVQAGPLQRQAGPADQRLLLPAR